MNVAPLGLALAAYRAAQRVRAEGFDFDLIDAHYYYPDGVAAALLARWLERPLVITARGTDINLIPAHAIPRRMVLWASRVAAHSISVCEALRTEMIALGMPPERVTTLRNGVDLQRFAPVERDAARARLGWGAGHVLLSVGLLIERKGHDLVIRALRELTDSRAVIVGRGELGSSLRALAQAEGVADRVTFVDEIEQSELRYYYSAADALVLGSSREGWANVLLEAMACGTPVVASNVWGTPEVVAAPEAGLLMRDRTPAAIVECVRRLRAAPPERAATRRFAERFSWDATTEGQLRIFERVLAERDSRRVRAAARGA
jgi:glycosyltransferase involved in cell wall biosynthesis